MHLALVIDIRGEVDQEGLNRLRSFLHLSKQGRLTDDWDQKFGSRVVRTVRGADLRVGLFRNFDGSWKIQVLGAQRYDSGSSEINSLRAELVEGIYAAGYEAAARAKPSFGTAEDA